MRILGIVIGVVILLAAAAAAYVRFAPPPAPQPALTAAPPASPNWALAAPPGVETAGAPTLEGPVYAATAEQVLAQLDAVAAAEPRVERLVAGPAERAYVQRSALVAFPDLISAAVVDLSGDAAAPRTGLVLYARSVYGRSDLGVNRARLERWIAALDGRLAKAP
ncbi:MAG: DUF1499 domain-containing protein [Pseudomonadota bacterium]